MTKPLFIVAAVGYIIAMIAAIWYIADWAFLYTDAILDIAMWWVFAVGLLLGSFAFLGYRSYYGSSMGLATFIISLVFIWFYPLGYTLWYTPLYFIGIFLEIIGVVLIGVMMILWGVSKIVVRNKTGQMGVTLAAGIIFIITGGFMCTYLFLLVGCIVLLPAAILGMTSLFLSLK